MTEMKQNRQEKILEMIASYPIGTQDEVIVRLREEGYNATQATVSRDIRALKLVKVLSVNGTYCYVLPRKETAASVSATQAPSYHKTYGDSILSVAYSMNNVVIKTAPGMASAVAVVLDHAYHEMMLGTVAGDDTILLVVTDNDAALALAEELKIAFGKK